MMGRSPWRKWVPWLALFVAVAAGYLDLRLRLVELEADGEAPPSGETPPAPPPPPAADAPMLAVDRPPVDAAAPGGSWGCAGILDPGVLRDVVGRRGPSVFACHREHGGGVAGTLTLVLRVEEDGLVSDASVTGSLAARPALLECARHEALGWRFEQGPTGGCAAAHIPFQFEGSRGQN